VFQGHTVYENCGSSALRGKRGCSTRCSPGCPLPSGRIDEILELIGLAADAERQAGLLAHGQKQWLEIGMLLAQDPKVLLVDEPVAGMTHAEMERTADLLKSLAGKHTIVVVEHDREFVRSIARRVTVLHEGKVLADGPMAQIQKNPRVVSLANNRRCVLAAQGVSQLRRQPRWGHRSRRRRGLPLPHGGQRRRQDDAAQGDRGPHPGHPGKVRFEDAELRRAAQVRARADRPVPQGGRSSRR
jgi:ABC-type multidrug transport system ATPase subunit